MLCARDRDNLVAHLRSVASAGLAAALEPLVRPCAILAAGAANGNSCLGGRPLAPRDFVWPRRTKSEVPLAFIAQLDLKEVPDSVRQDLSLPSSGLLTLFYDADEQPWGFDPADAGGWALYWFPQGDRTIDAPDDLPEVSDFPRVDVCMELGWTTPSDPFSPPPGIAIAPELMREWRDILCDDKGANEPYYPPSHRLGGWPNLIQGDIQLEAQLVSHGIYCGGPEGYRRGAHLEAGAGAWRLLLEIGSDDDAGMMWGDLGGLYLSMTDADLRDRTWQNSWMILQCG